jgi:hypothetical protein
MSKRLGTTRPGAERRAVGERAMTTTTARTPRHSTKLLLAVVVGALALLAAGVGPATAAPAASLQATSTCWQQVINDWLPDNKVDRTYAIPCYTQAIQHLSQYPDVAGYSSAEDDIRRALLAAIRLDRGNGGGGTGLGTGGPGPSGGGSTPSGSGKGGGGGFFNALGDRLGPGNAQSIPLPLIVLAGLALLLLLAAGGTWFARRLQARRVSPAPATAPVGPKRRY